MSSLIWPTEIHTRLSGRVLLGRLVHWMLTLAAVGLLGLTILMSAALLHVSEVEPWLWGDPALVLTFAGSLGAVGVFLAGRTLRFVLARE